MTRKTLIIILSRLMLFLSCGCQNGQPEEAVVADYDYDQYLVFPTELPEPLYYPTSEEFTIDGVLNHEDWSIAMAAYVSRNADMDTNRQFNQKLMPFYLTMMKQLLGNGGENSVFSPVNLYFNFTSLTSITQGAARGEILDLLGIDEETAAEDYQRQWRDNQVSGKTVINYASSIWFSDKLSLKKDNLETVSDDYYTPVFVGKTGTDGYTRAFQSWLNDNTGKLLGKYISQLKLDEQIKMALASTICFKGSWMEGYLPENTKKETFHGAAGDVQADMMHKSTPMIYIDTPLFKGCVENIGTGTESVIMLLPEEGVSFQQVLDSEEFLQTITGEWSGMFDEQKMSYPIINLALPKFDVSAKYRLEEIMPDMGIKGVFGRQADAFGPITDERLSVSSVEHACRVKADENGIEAAAYTVEMAIGGAPAKQVNLTFDRPFLFVIMTQFDMTPFFAGIVANP